MLGLFRRSPPWDEVDYWSLDLELSGLKPKKDHILSVGMVPIRRGVIAWGERYYSLVRPEGWDGLTEETMAVHHILPEELHGAPPLEEVLPEIERRLDGGIMLVHHAPLDVAFLKRACKARGRRRPWDEVVDTMRLLLRLDHRRHQLDPYGRALPKALSQARAHLGLPAYDYHHALTDALATAELFLLLRHRLGARRLRQLT